MSEWKRESSTVEQAGRIGKNHEPNDLVQKVQLADDKPSPEPRNETRAGEEKKII